MPRHRLSTRTGSIRVSDGVELLTNGGFETAGAGGADIWDTWIEDTAIGGALANETTIVKSGSDACKSTCGGSNSQYSDVKQIIETTNGNVYAYTFWTRGDGTNSGCYYIYDEEHSADITSGIVSTGISGTTYTIKTIYATSPGNSTSFWFLSPLLANGIAYFDDVSVKLLTPSLG